jgi:hypothetical protein
MSAVGVYHLRANCDWLNDTDYPLCGDILHILRRCVQELRRAVNWTAANTGLPPNIGVPALTVDPTTPTALYAGTAGLGVFNSTCGGANWTAANTGLTATWVFALAIDPTTPTTLYAGRLTNRQSQKYMKGSSES